MTSPASSRLPGLFAFGFALLTYGIAVPSGLFVPARHVTRPRAVLLIAWLLACLLLAASPCSGCSYAAWCVPALSTFLPRQAILSGAALGRLVGEFLDNYEVARLQPPLLFPSLPFPARLVSPRILSWLPFSAPLLSPPSQSDYNFGRPSDYALVGIHMRKVAPPIYEEGARLI